MNTLKYLTDNAKWTFKKQHFEELVTEPTTRKQLVYQLEKLSCNSFPENAHVETTNTEFCLNAIALSRANTVVTTYAKELFGKYWLTFDRVRRIFSQKHLTFPSNEKGTRLMQIADLITKCTQGVYDERLPSVVKKVFTLTQREEQHLTNALSLSQINYYCALTTEATCGAVNETKLSPLCSTTSLLKLHENNENYSHSSLTNGTMHCVVNCFGESALSLFGKSLHVVQSLKLNRYGKNIFDSFTNHKYGKRTVEHSATSYQTEITMQTYFKNNNLVKRVRLTNKSKSFAMIKVKIPFYYEGNDVEQFENGNAVCLALQKENVYVALAVVKDCETIRLNKQGDEYCFNVKLLPSQTVKFDVVTLAKRSMPVLAMETEKLEEYGATNCPYVFDCKKNAEFIGEKTQVNVASNLVEETFNHSPVCYTFTDSLVGDVATLFDKKGNSTTLLNGFMFGIGGEKFWGITNNKITNLKQNLSLDENGLLSYQTANCLLNVSETTGKRFDFCFNTDSKLLAVFPLEEKSQIIVSGNVFEITSKSRRFKMTFSSVDSYTTCPFECNEMRLRAKLSNTLQESNYLAVCTKGRHLTVDVTPYENSKHSPPLLRESLVTTYLNYVNGKNVFNLTNNLKPADPLVVSAITYTDSAFVKDYLLSHKDGVSYCYNSLGQKVKHASPFTFALGALYYTSLTGDNCFENDFDHIQRVAFSSQQGIGLCLKALLLKKMINFEQFDKVKVLIEYDTAKKQIEQNPQINGYAQAIGAITMNNPCKARLRDLCTNNNVPKCFYYVSQIENLYGISIKFDKLSVKPNVSSDNELENLAMFIDGKRIETHFNKSNVNSMSLNGVTLYSPFKPKDVCSADNTLFVGYK